MTLGRKNSSRLQDTGRILHCLVLDVKFLLGVITGDAPVPNEQFGPNTAWGPPDLHKAVCHVIIVLNCFFGLKLSLQNDSVRGLSKHGMIIEPRGRQNP